MNTFAFYMSCITIVMLIIMGIYIAAAKNKKLLHYIFLMVVIELFIWTGAGMLRGIYSNNATLYIMWENVTYIGAAFVPVCLLLLGRAYAQADKWFSRKLFLLLIIPVVTQIMVWTNEPIGFHNLFIVDYPIAGENATPGVFGIYFYIIHASYSYICMVVGLAYLSYFAIKNSGILSVQAVLIILGSIIPMVVNVTYTFNLFGDVYSTPIAFAFTLALYLLGMFQFNLLKVTPIALQTVINRISDSFIVVDTDMHIIFHNKPFTDNFHYFSHLKRDEDFYRILEENDRSNMSAPEYKQLIVSASESSKTLIKDMEIEIEGSKQYFTVEFTPIVQRNRSVAVVLLYKNITQHIKDMQTIRDNQAILLERERLASLGQLIGGIAHNLKTPIMSVAGGIDQLRWLSEEYESSLEDAEVTVQDHKEISGEMQQWLGKMKTHLAYMSDIISTVKDQASKFNNPEQEWFTLDEVLKRVKILMQHEVIKNKCRYTQNIKVDSDTRIDGDINALVQILDNIIVNAIQAYDGTGGEIVLEITKQENQLLVTICDFGQGIEEKVKNRLFKEMITTKGKHGTGLGLYMSYSTIKGMFRGDMWFESNVGKGTKFFIQLPVQDRQLGVERYA